MPDPRTTPAPQIRKRDIVVRQGTEQPRGVVVTQLLPIEDNDLRGLRSAPIEAGWYAVVMWHNRKRLVAEPAEHLTKVGDLSRDD